MYNSSIPGISGIVFVGVAGIFLLQTGQETCFLPLQSDQNGISLCTVTQTNSNRTSAICKAQKRFIEVQLSIAFQISFTRNRFLKPQK
jgi:hypothetical protein